MAEDRVFMMDVARRLGKRKTTVFKVVRPLAGRPTEGAAEDELAAIWADVPEAEWRRLPADLTDFS
jgi:hypothetical protein